MIFFFLEQLLKYNQWKEAIRLSIGWSNDEYKEEDSDEYLDPKL